MTPIIAVLVAGVAQPAVAAGSPGAEPTGRVVNGFDLRQGARPEGVMGRSPAYAIGGVVVEPGGNIVVAGNSGSPGVLSRIPSVLTVARYTPAGTLDPSFGSGGIARPLGGVVANGLLRRPDGSFVVRAYESALSAPPVGRDWLVALTSSGARDPSFGGAGIFGFPAEFSSSSSVSLDTGGGVIIAGPHYPPGKGTAVARVTAAGKLDPAFGSGGFADFHIGYLLATAADPGGDVFAIGQTASLMPVTALIRLSPTGVLRSGYGNGGIVTFPENENEEVLALGAGKVLIAARNFSAEASTPVVIRRLLADGSLDPSFGNAGSVQLPIGYGPKLLRGPAGGTDIIADFEDADRGVQITRLGPNGAVLQPPQTIAEGFGGGSYVGEGDDELGVSVDTAPAARSDSFEATVAAGRPDGGFVLGGSANISFEIPGTQRFRSSVWGLESLRPDLTPDPSFGTIEPVNARLRLRHGKPRAASRFGVPVRASMTDRGEIEVRITTRRHGRKIIIATRTIVFQVAKAARLRIPATGFGQRLLRRVSRVRLTISGRATIVGGESRRLRHTSLTLRMSRIRSR